jgi:hypothetical protein
VFFSTGMLVVAVLLAANAPLPDIIMATTKAPRVAPEAVLSKLKNVRAWSQWTDTFSVEVDGDVLVGAQLHVTPNWGESAYGFSTKGPEEVTVWDDNPLPSHLRGKLCWVYTLLPTFLLTTDRCVEVSAADHDGTAIVNRIQFMGLLGPLVDYVVGAKVQALFEQFNVDLLAAAVGSGSASDPD